MFYIKLRVYCVQYSVFQFLLLSINVYKKKKTKISILYFDWFVNYLSVGKRDKKSQNTSCLLTWMYLKTPCVCIFYFIFYATFFFSLSTLLPLIDHDLSSQYDSTVPGCFLTLIIAASWFTTGAILSVGSSWLRNSRREERPMLLL